jgi:hypothetical protein
MLIARKQRLLKRCASIKNVAALQKCKTKRLDHFSVTVTNWAFLGKM